MAGQQRKMVNIDVSETSGVDHPAHLHEGWIVCKSATQEHVEALFGPLSTRKGTDVADKQTTTEPAEKAAGPTVEELQKQVETLTAERDEALAKAATAPAPVEKAADSQEEMLKALPAPVREMIEKQARETEELRKQAVQDREDMQKERDARLDQAAIVEFAGMFKSVALDATTVAPAIRRIGTINPDLAKAVTEALKAADGQLESASIFKEIGNPGNEGGNGGSAVAKIEAAAAEIRKSETGKDLTAEQAFAKALQVDPELYSEYLAEQAGK